MRTEFNNLVDLMNKYSLYHSTDEVGIALNDLEKVITELEKRMECIEKCADEINNAISRYTQRVDNNETFIMSINDHDSIMRGSHDIEIALDLNDKEVIENNWYGLFAEPKKEEPKVLIPKDSIVEWKEERNHYNVKGGAKARVTEDYTTEHESNDKCILVEWLDEKANGQNNGGYYLEMFKENFVQLEWLDEKPSVPTFLCYSDDNHNIVNDVISKLKDIGVDGETMQYIIEQVGMNDQMLRQLIMSNPHTDTTDILEERRILSNRGELYKKTRGCIEI